MRTGGGSDEPGVQTAHSPPLSCGGSEPHGSCARSDLSPAKRGAGDRPDRPATEYRQCATTAGVVAASTGTCGPCFECSATHWLIRQDRSCGTHARPFVHSPGSARRRDACCSCGTCSCHAWDLSAFRTCSCPAWDPSDFPTCSCNTRHFSDFRTSGSVWHAGFRVQDDCTAWTQLQTRCRHGTAA
jgi:hypothetical protein